MNWSSITYKLIRFPTLITHTHTHTHMYNTFLRTYIRLILYNLHIYILHVCINRDWSGKPLKPEPLISHLHLAGLMI